MLLAALRVTFDVTNPLQVSIGDQGNLEMVYGNHMQCSEAPNPETFYALRMFHILFSTALPVVEALPFSLC